MNSNRSRKRKASSELIDTLWNVNKIIAKIMNPAVKELIDTLWNVNKI